MVQWWEGTLHTSIPAFIPALSAPLTPHLGLCPAWFTVSAHPELVSHASTVILKIFCWPQAFCLTASLQLLFTIASRSCYSLQIYSTHQVARGQPQQTLHKPELHEDGPHMQISTSTNDITNQVSLPATANRWERDGLELLIVGQGQAILHCLFQKFLTLVCTPDWTVTVDHKLGRQAMACADSSWRERNRNSELHPSARLTAPDAQPRALWRLLPN